MNKQRTKTVSDWNELLEFVKDVNNHRYAVVLSGYNMKIVDGEKTEIDELRFQTKPIDILLPKKANDKRYIEKNKISDILDKTYYSIPSEERGYYERFFYKLKYLLDLD